jgi:hypothetical protein
VDGSSPGPPNGSAEGRSDAPSRRRGSSIVTRRRRCSARGDVAMATLGYVRKRYAQRRDQGVCVACGRAAADHGVLCAGCSARMAEYQRRYRLAHQRERAASCRTRYAQRRDQGVCVACGRAAADHGVRCAACARKRAEGQVRYFRARYAQRRAQGICVECGRAAADHGIYCEQCAGWRAGIRKRYLRRHPPKRAAYYRARYARLRSQGKCVRCGRAAADHGARCEACARKLAAYARALRARRQVGSGAC